MFGLYQEKWINRLILVLLAIGIFLRLNRYLCNFPFWGDEAWVALDVASRSAREIYLGLEHDSSFSTNALGFMFVERFLITVWGTREIVFRFFPCFFGVASIFLFRRLLQKLKRPRAMLMAFVLFVFSNSLIFYSSELKQYSFDVFFVIGVYLFHFRALKHSMDRKSTLWLILAGLIGMFFSLPIILVLCGIAIGQVVIYFESRQLRELGRYLLVFGVWLVGFWGLWQSTYCANYVSCDVQQYTKQYYLSFPPVSGDWAGWFQKIFFVFQNPVELPWPWLSAGIFVVGCWSLGRQKKALLFSLFFPLILTIGLSMGDKYPFFGRFLVFLLPSFYIIIAQGLDFVMNDRRWQYCLGIFILLMMLIPSVANAKRYVVPSAVTDIRTLMLYMREHQKLDDSIYMNNETKWSYYFYYPLINFKNELVEKGTLAEHAFLANNQGQTFLFVNPDRSKIRRVYSWDNVVDEKGIRTRLPGGGRTWILLSQVDPAKENTFIRCFNSFGTKLDEVRSQNASLYLYNLK